MKLQFSYIIDTFDPCKNRDCIKILRMTLIFSFYIYLFYPTTKLMQ